MTDHATPDEISRLFGRAAFGATYADLQKWVGQHYSDAVDSLFPPAPVGSTDRAVQPDEAARVTLEQQTNTIDMAQKWWLERMRTTPYPLEERMTLFWHDHFATAYSGQPDTGQMAIQNQTLRRHSLGSFRELANAMLVDPAMLVWLNGIANHKNGVNENLAREFLELFTLGTVPQEYTETDIRQAAKVLTGFTVNTTTRQPVFTPARHDNSQKTVLGRPIGGYPAADARNAVEYKEVTEAALLWKNGLTASRFLAYKLVLAFGYPVAAADIATDPLIDAVAADIRLGDKWDLRAGVRTMLLHTRWRHAAFDTGRQLVRSPIELVVHGAKLLGVNCNLPANTIQNQLPLTSLQRAGQVPFRPPNVGGWPTGAGWLSQTTTLGRYDMFHHLVTAYRNQHGDKTKPLPPSGDVNAWKLFMGLWTLSTGTTLRLQEYLASPGTTVEADKQAGMFILLGSSPEWQVM